MLISPKLSSADLALAVFPSELGWIALRGVDSQLGGLSFGHPTPEAALAAVGRPVLGPAPDPSDWNPRLRQQLQAYAQGEVIDFRWVPIAWEPGSPFRRRIGELCREIPYGQTLSYGQLAARAGSPGASRAVGACMAGNRVPLVIPCHRVVASNGGLGGFSAPGGLGTKRALLNLEARGLAMREVG